MSDQWDVIVVGAGVGGLTAAARLVKRGLRVLVLEKNPHPGGTAYVYHRKGFTFPMGPLGFGTPLLVQETLRDFGEEDLNFHRIHYRVRAFDLEVPLSLSFSEMKKALAQDFPPDARGIEKFFQDIEAIASNSFLPNAHLNHSIQKSMGEISAAEYLNSLIGDWRLRRILGSLGTREPCSSLSLLAAMWKLMCKGGIWYPEEGMKAFCERLAKAVFVISNADYKTTFLKLIDPLTIPSKCYHAVLKAKQTGSVLQVCLGVNADRVDLSSFDKASRLIYRRDPGSFEREEEIDWNVVELNPETLARQELEVCLWSKEDKTLAPDGCAVIVIRTEAICYHFARYRSVFRKRHPDYNEHKIRLGRALIRELENLIPGLEKAVLVMDVATPLTFEDQGGRSEGAVAGWSWDYEDFFEDRPRELVRTPIKGLYMAGYQAFSALFMGGVPTAIESGNRAAEAVLQNMGPVEEIMLPGLKDGG